MDENRCIICWEVIPEGRMVCPSCHAAIMRKCSDEEQSQPRKEVRTMINWKVRIKNKQFWLTLIPAVLLLIQVVLNVFGITFDFGEIGNKLTAVINAVFAVLTILGIVTDPTTEGVKDSKRAMSYQEPYKDFVEEED